MSSTPTIAALQWADIRSVLPHEAHDFTPWLAENLDLLADVLGLEDLDLEATESSIDEFRLDVLATGTDGAGDQLAVVIENQYGRTDHDHLGKLITYAARAEAEADRVLGVWIVERAHPAHLAAVEFLNRVSSTTVGWVLVAPRFAPAPQGYYVHFDLLAEPNEFLRSAPPKVAGASNPERASFMQSVFEAVETELKSAGFRHVWVHPKGSMIRAYLPRDIPAQSWAEVRVLAGKTRFRSVLFIRGSDAGAEHNYEVLEGIRQRHAEDIEAAVAQPLEWHARSEGDRSDYARSTWEGHGYTNAAPADAAHHALTFAIACIDALRLDTDEDFPDPDELEAAPRADAGTVMRVASLIRPGEWATYGDVSTAITGSSTAAMAIGNIARSREDFPTPHRLLNASGKVPDAWTTTDGTGGPEVCRELLQDEGVAFNGDGSASSESRVPSEVLRARLDEASS